MRRLRFRRARRADGARRVHAPAPASKSGVGQLRRRRGDERLLGPDAFVGTKRLQLTKEGAARANIRLGIERLSQLAL
jgi:hypothetical protein